MKNLSELNPTAQNSELEKKLHRSGLPKGSKDRLRKHFAKSLVESYKALGLSDAEAKLAAGIEGALHVMKQSGTELYVAAKAMGMRDAEAKAFFSTAASCSATSGAAGAVTD